MFQHIGITITDKDDIESFYKTLLGLEEVKRFDLPEDLAEQLFDIRRKVPVTVVSRDDLVIELFLTDEQADHGFNHVGISVPDRQDLMKRAEGTRYEVTYIEREAKAPLLFITDRSGNRFEIKGA